MSRFAGWAVECQTLTLDQQLRAGIRALDIRCRCINNAFTIHHAGYYQQATFVEVLRTTINYLNKNPSETVLMRVNQDYKAEGCQGEFQSQFNMLYWNNEEYSGYFERTDIENMTLGEVMKKLLFYTTSIQTRTLSRTISI